MSLHAVAVLCIIITCMVLSLGKHPFWGLVGYVFLYFNIPNPSINWWASDLPELRWSLSAAGIVIISMIIHADKLHKVPLTKPLNIVDPENETVC